MILYICKYSFFDTNSFLNDAASEEVSCLSTFIDISPCVGCNTFCSYKVFMHFVQRAKFSMGNKFCMTWSWLKKRIKQFHRAHGDVRQVGKCAVVGGRAG